MWLMLQTCSNQWRWGYDNHRNVLFTEVNIRHARLQVQANGHFSSEKSKQRSSSFQFWKSSTNTLFCIGGGTVIHPKTNRKTKSRSSPRLKVYLVPSGVVGEPRWEWEVIHKKHGVSFLGHGFNRDMNALLGIIMSLHRDGSKTYFSSHSIHWIIMMTNKPIWTAMSLSKITIFRHCHCRKPPDSGVIQENIYM